MSQNDHSYASVEHSLLCPSELWCTKDLRQTRGIIPRRAGIYAWFASCDAFPFPVAGSGWTHAGWSPIYIGKAIKSGGLSRRLHAHFNRDAGHSNFRLHLGVALRNRLKLELLHKQHIAFLPIGETILSDWLDSSCRLSWLEVDDPQASLAEKALIHAHHPPLNTESQWFSDNIAVTERQLVEGCGTRTRSWRRWSPLSARTNGS